MREKTASSKCGAGVKARKRGNAEVHYKIFGRDLAPYLPGMDSGYLQKLSLRDHADSGYGWPAGDPSVSRRIRQRSLHRYWNTVLRVAVENGNTFAGADDLDDFAEGLELYVSDFNTGAGITASYLQCGTVVNFRVACIAEMSTDDLNNNFSTPYHGGTLQDA